MEERYKLPDPFIGNDEVDDKELYRLVREYYEDVCDDNEGSRGMDCI